MKRNKANTRVNTYPSPHKATDKVVSDVNSILVNENIRVLWSNKDLKNLNTHDTLHKLPYSLGFKQQQDVSNKNSLCETL